MKGVLGIDAAWTEQNESGISLVVHGPEGWKVKVAASSAGQFCRDMGECSDSTKGTTVDGLKRAIELASTFCGGELQLIAVDMPLSLQPITGRRVADQAVSKTYGGRCCSTHSPSPERPGRLSSEIVRVSNEMGFSLCTTEICAPGLVEVYPHPALVELLNAKERLRYKVGKSAKLFPGLDSEARKEEVKKVWLEIARAADKEIQGFFATVQQTIEVHKVSKKGEDLLDSLVCAWIGLRCLEQRAKPYGDSQASIWIPDGRQSSSPQAE